MEGATGLVEWRGRAGVVERAWSSGVVECRGDGVAIITWNTGERRSCSFRFWLIERVGGEPCGLRVDFSHLSGHGYFFFRRESGALYVIPGDMEGNYSNIRKAGKS